jgi:hypothetical protein
MAKVSRSDGFAFVSPADHDGERGRNGFGLADTCCGGWEIVLNNSPKIRDPSARVAVTSMCPAMRVAPCVSVCADQLTPTRAMASVSP